MTRTSYNPPAFVGRFGQRALIVGLLGLAVCGVGFVLDREQFFRAYLVGFLFWIGIALGSLGLMMVQYLSGGAWGLVIRRILEAASRTIFPIGVVLFIPIIFGMHDLYHWTHAEVVAADPILKHKEAYLNTPFFLARTAGYFLIWGLLSMLFSRWSKEHDASGSQQVRQRLSNLSGPGIVIFCLTVSLAAMDWAMSLDPHWYSTIYGLLLIAGQAISAMAFAIMMAMMLSKHEPMSEVYRPTHFHDLGKLLLAFIMLWAYFAFSQLLIIWSANLPEEIPWYLRRFNSGYRYVGIALLLLHFALPFALLLSRDLKRNARRLAVVAGLVLVMRVVDLVWLVSPAFKDSHLASGWMFVAAPIGLGGIWLWWFARELQGRPLLPVNEPNFEALLAAEQH
ncbi:MAG: hypothetical protein ABI882_11010 [Acidobacteriota bacterium]